MKEERPSTAVPGNGAMRTTMSGRSPQSALRSNLRGANFAEGEAMLAPVQRRESKAAPSDESPATLRGEIDALKLQGRQRAAAAVSRDLDTISRQLTPANLSLNMLESYLEDAILNDAEQGKAQEAYGKATEAYLKSKRPNWLNVVSAILDVGSALRGLVTVGKAIVDAAQVAHLVGPAVDGTFAVNTLAKGVAEGAKLPGLGAPDETSALVGSVQAEVNVLVAKVTLLESFALGGAQASLMTSMNFMSNKVASVFDELPLIGEGTPEYLAGASRAAEVVGELSAFADDLEKRMEHIKNIMAARDAGGGAALVGGTAERGLFEELSSDEDLRSRAVLTIEQRLEVDCSSRTRLVEQARPTRFSISVGDAEKHAVWSKGLNPVPEMVSPAFMKSRDEVAISEPMSRALGVLGIAKVLVPPSTVYLYGGDITRTIGIAEFRADPDAAWRKTQGLTYPDER